MARIRTIKPELAAHEGLFDLELETGLPIRFAWVMLLTVADREGRFQWRPRTLKVGVLPLDDVDFSAVLGALERGGFIVRYEVDGEVYGCIPTWSKHQAVNVRETASKIPAPSKNHTDAMHARACTDQGSALQNGVNIPVSLRETILARDGYRCLRCNATDDLTVDHIFPRSIGGTHAVTNLRTLCRACNSRRPVHGAALIDDLKSDGLSMDDMQRMCMHVHARGERKGREGERKGKERTFSAAPAAPPPPGELIPPEPPVLTFLLNDGSEFGITQQQVDEFRGLFPAIDVMQELRSMKAWCIGNRQNRKTRSGALKFITGWLGRAQNRAPPVQGMPMLQERTRAQL